MTSSRQPLTRHKPYRVIYQADTSWRLPNSRDAHDYLHGIMGFIAETHVDAYFWHDGAGGNTANYDSDVLELTGARIGKVDPVLQRLLDEGNDPAKIVIPYARELGVDIFYSFRLNDCHDSLGDGQSHPQLLATFKTENPDWVIGPGHPYGGVNQLNFAVPEVVDLKFAVIEEVFAKYEFDGLEIDFLRSAPYFIPGTEPEQADILTGFLRRVRQHLAGRGRKITVAVRVSESMEACQLDGFDVAAWVQEDLVDLIILGSGAVDIEVEAFKELTDGTGILVYPCLYAWPSGYGRATPEMVRALAANYWYQGADGLYLFNWNAHTYVHGRNEPENPNEEFAHLLDRLREIDDPESLRGKDKQFLADRGGAPDWAYPHNWMHTVLPATLEAGEQIEVPLLVGEDLGGTPAPKSVQLLVELKEPDGEIRDATVEASLNGHLLQLSDPVEYKLVAQVDREQLMTGRNLVRVAAKEGLLDLNAIRLDVRY